ncbi:MAG: LPXTG cell wall anchor domain-containing protein, partial [Clostridia bacterium]|nr:LPXTG cell wall anchor domain-containing protein [Clostridia bacterium]
GWYMLEETGMPAGYIKKEGPYYIHINEDGSVTLDTTVAHVLISPESGNEYTIENEPGSELPSTGGIGTGLYYILGLVMMLGAGGALIIRKRKKMRR